MFDNGTDALANITAILAILAAVGWMLRFVYKATKTVARVDDAIPTLLEIAKEFKPNGGNSLKDHVSAIRAEQTLSTARELKIAGDLAVHIEADAKIQDTLAGHLQSIDESLKGPKA